MNGYGSMSWNQKKKANLELIQMVKFNVILLILLTVITIVTQYDVINVMQYKPQQSVEVIECSFMPGVMM